MAPSNVERWIRDRGDATYAELHAFSIQEPEAFLSQALARLGIRFLRPFTRVFDTSAGVDQPRWFPDARLNISENAFHAPAGEPAIVSRREGESGLRRLSVGELDLLSRRVARGLVDAGFGVGDRIAIDMPMTPECVAAYLGIVRAGMVVVSIADSFAAEEIRLRLDIAGARALVTQDVIFRAGKRIPLYERVLEATDLPVIVCRTAVGESIDLRPGDRDFSDLVAVGDEFDAVPAAAGDPINVLFSSGTTGRPKAIPWSHATPIRSALDGHVHLDVRPGDVVAWPTNIGWMMGPWLIFAALINRATIALFEGAPQSRDFGAFVADAGVTQLGVVPSLVRTWRSTRCMDGLDWKRIRAFGSTGEASNAEDMKWLMSLAGGAPVIEYCGGTETGGSYITSTVFDPAPPGRFSAKTIGSDFVILDESGRESAVGEVFLIPPVLGHSTRLLNADHHEVYFSGCPRGPSGQVLRRHGDVIERLPDGTYRALGRADDTMNLGGIKVSAVELEAVMNTCAAVTETAAIAVSPEGGGPSDLVVYAVLEPNAVSDTGAIRTQLQKRIRDELNPLFRISDVRTIEALPRTASNKVMRRVLRDLYRQDHRV